MTDHTPPQLDFNALVLSFGSSALIHLGLAPDPTTQQLAPVDLQLAQQSIDLLALLQEKTRGNLTPEEASFLQTLLYDLRMRFVDAARAVQLQGSEAPKP